MKTLARAMLCFALLWAGAAAQAAMVLQSYNANQHDRFQNNAAFIGNPYNWSGVGRGTAGRWGVMISDSYFLTATHFVPSGTLRFYHTNNPAGTFEDHLIASGQQIAGSDLWLGKLQDDVTASVQKYPILDLPTLSAYNNRTIYTFGLTGASEGDADDVRLGRNQIDPNSYGFATVGPSTGAAYTFDFDNPGGVGADESFLQGGDSGGPSFNLAAGVTPAITGIHWAISTNPIVLSIDTFVPFYIANLQAAMIGEDLMLIPEPTSGLLLALGSILVMGTIRRSRRFADE